MVMVLLIIAATMQGAFAASRAKYAGEFIAIGVGGRALGLGGAYAALANDVTAGYWNPAGLSGILYPEITLMHDERFGDLVNYDYGAFALPVGKNSTLAFSVIRLGVDGIPDTRNALIDNNGNGIFDGADRLDYSKISYFNAADWALYFSYAKKTGENFSYGANLKLIRRNVADTSATGIGFDLGLQYFFSDKFTIGVNLQDATTTLIAWDSGTNELISPTLKVGSAYFLNAFGGKFAPAVDVDIRFEGRRNASNAHLGAVSFDFHTGLEFDYKNIVALRAGRSDIGSLNLGTGIHLPKFNIDYSFAKFDAADQLGNTHRISVTFVLEAEQFARSSQ